VLIPFIGMRLDVAIPIAKSFMPFLNEFTLPICLRSGTMTSVALKMIRN
jgi:hypothetical protein